MMLSLDKVVLKNPMIVLWKNLIIDIFYFGYIASLLLIRNKKMGRRDGSLCNYRKKTFLHQLNKFLHLVILLKKNKNPPTNKQKTTSSLITIPCVVRMAWK